MLLNRLLENLVSESKNISDDTVLTIIYRTLGRKSHCKERGTKASYIVRNDVEDSTQAT